MKNDLAGVIHNHCSDYSPDATEPLDSMVKNAAKANLDFIIFTDHNSLGVKQNKRDKNINGVQVIAGAEITPGCKFVRYENISAKHVEDDNTSGHLLLVDLDELPSDELIEEGVCQEMIDFANERRLLTFIAHPDHKGSKAFGVPSYRCNNFDITDHTGFSLWDLQTDCQAFASSIPRGLFGLFFPALVPSGPEPETLARWDELTKERSCTVIGELDQHAYKYKLYGLSFTVFKSSFAFRTVRTHVITDAPVDTESDFKHDVIEALRRGHSYVSYDYFKDATGFTFSAEHAQERYIMGDTVKKGDSDVRFSVSTPTPAEIKIIKDGEELSRHHGDSLDFSVTEKGVYRVEARLKKYFKLRPWIFSNTIRVV